MTFGGIRDQSSKLIMRLSQENQDGEEADLASSNGDRNSMLVPMTYAVKKTPQDLFIPLSSMELINDEVNYLIISNSEPEEQSGTARNQTIRILSKESHNEMSQVPSKTSLAQGQEQPALVLVADDCPFNIFAVQSLIEQLGVYAEFCTNGEEAVEAVRKRVNNSNLPMYQLILLDYSMPIFTGPEATRQIRDMLEQKGFAPD